MRFQRLLSSHAHEVFDEGVEDVATVAAADDGFGAALGVGHHAENIAALVDDTCDVAGRAVGVGCGGEVAVSVAVAEDDAVFGFEFVENGVAGVVVAFAMSHRDLDELPLAELVGERRVGVFGAEEDGLARETERGISGERSRQETTFTQDLETVADAENHAAVVGEADDILHDR